MTDHSTPRAIPQWLLAIDPGPHTGIAHFLNGHLVDITTVAEPTIPSNYRELAAVFALMYEGTEGEVGATQVVIEDFRTQMPLTRAGYATIQLIGFLAGTAYVAGVPVALQLPAVRRPFLDDALPLMRAFPARVRTPHARDAVAHGLAYLNRLACPPLPALPLHPHRSYEDMKGSPA